MINISVLCLFFSRKLDDLHDTSQLCNLHIFYHPPDTNDVFTDHLMELITAKVSSNSKDIFLGDFNLHWNDPKDPHVNAIKDLLADQALTHVCSHPTHLKGATLDWIIAKESTVKLIAIDPCDWSDHYAITFLLPGTLKTRAPQQVIPIRWVRDTKNLDPRELAARCKSDLPPSIPQRLTTSTNITL